MTLYELDHWVLFDTMKPDQINRLKNVIDRKVEKPSESVPADSFRGMLSDEIEKLDREG